MCIRDRLTPLPFKWLNFVLATPLLVTDRAEYLVQEFEKIRVLIAYDGVVHWEPGGVFLASIQHDQEKCPDSYTSLLTHLLAECS